MSMSRVVVVTGANFQIVKLCGCRLSAVSALAQLAKRRACPRLFLFRQEAKAVDGLVGLRDQASTSVGHVTCTLVCSQSEAVNI